LFEQLFSELQIKVKEMEVIGVWGKDGLELEKQKFSELEIDLDFTGAEMADIISKIDNATKISPDKFFISLGVENHQLLIYSLTPDYFLIILANSDIIIGKLSFYLQLYKEKIIAIL